MMRWLLRVYDPTTLLFEEILQVIHVIETSEDIEVLEETAVGTTGRLSTTSHTKRRRCDNLLSLYLHDFHFWMNICLFHHSIPPIHYLIITFLPFTI